MKTTLKLALLAILAALVYGQSASVTTFPDISGSSATVPLNATGSCVWVQIVAPAANAAISRWGDVTTGATRGGLLPAGSGQFLPPRPINDQLTVSSQLYSLASLYVYVASGDKITFVCGH